MGFRLGDYEFESDQARRAEQRTLIRGAATPGFLRGVATAVDADNASPAARLLLDGAFCGHGEPAFAVFELSADGCDRWLVWEREDGIAVRAANGQGDWIVLYDRGWIKIGIPRDELPNAPVRIAVDQRSTADVARNLRMYVAVGVAYPRDCAAEDDISWLAIAVGDGLERAEIVLSEEMA